MSFALFLWIGQMWPAFNATDAVWSKAAHMTTDAYLRLAPLSFDSCAPTSVTADGDTLTFTMCEPTQYAYLPPGWQPGAP